MSQRNKTDKDLPVMSVNNRLGFINQSEQFEDRIVASDDTSNYKVVSRNEFAYNPARINVGSIARYCNDNSCIVSPMYVCFKCYSKVLPQYIEAFFGTAYFRNEMQKRLEGSVRQCLSFESLCNIPIELPDLSTQKRIVCILSKLNEKIALEEAYLSNLQSQKHYILKQMFV